ncbi:hypothetical protein AgCh_028461 [Apium graveolens]
MTLFFMLMAMKMFLKVLNSSMNLILETYCLSCWPVLQILGYLFVWVSKSKSKPKQQLNLNTRNCRIYSSRSGERTVCCWFCIQVVRHVLCYIVDTTLICVQQWKGA